eukprot:tig00020629_g12380.t1
MAQSQAPAAPREGRAGGAGQAEEGNEGEAGGVGGGGGEERGVDAVAVEELQGEGCGGVGVREEPRVDQRKLARAHGRSKPLSFLR